MSKGSGVRIAAKWMLVSVYVLALALIGARIFFEEQFSSMVSYFSPQVEIHGSAELVTVGYAYMPGSLDPVVFDPVTRSYLVDIYEGLVRTDRDLKIKPGLAVSWGLLDDNTWEFRLRPGVMFHDGGKMTVNDAVVSLERARSARESQLVDLFSTIESVLPRGEDRLVIKTRVPDPYLLNKLAVTFIHPASLKDFSEPVGTGPYGFSGMDGDELKLSVFTDYWSERPYFNNAVLKFIPGRADRIDALQDGKIDLLTNMPPNYACSKTEKYRKADGCNDLRNDAVRIKSVPSLEVSFIVFNQKNDIFSRREVRQAIVRAFDQQVFVDLAFGFARPVGQFVSNGVFGFNPAIDKPACEPEEARTQFVAACADIFDVMEVTFDYPEGLDTIGEYVKDTLRGFGLIVNLNPLSGEELQRKVTEGSSDFYFLGWRSELGYALDFLKSVAHSKDASRGYGTFNGSGYRNAKVDDLIKASERNLDTESRLKQLQEVMRIIVEEDIYGVPLFESETVFGFHDGIGFDPRIDGFVHISELYGKNR